MKPCQKEFSSGEVFCEDCVSFRVKHYDMGVTIQCRATQVLKYNYEACWYEYLDASDVNVNNDCKLFSPITFLPKKVWRIIRNWARQF